MLLGHISNSKQVTRDREDGETVNRSGKEGMKRIQGGEGVDGG